MVGKSERGLRALQATRRAASNKAILIFAVIELCASNNSASIVNLIFFGAHMGFFNYDLEILIFLYLIIFNWYGHVQIRRKQLNKSLYILNFVIGFFIPLSFLYMAALIILSKPRIKKFENTSAE